MPGQRRDEPVERIHTGILLHALYPLGGKVPGLSHVPLRIRRAARRALTSAAVRAHLARCRRVRIAAVTGSLGKTTTKDLLAEMLAVDGPTTKTRQNDNGLYGVPASLLTIRPSDRHAVIEVGIHETPGEMIWMAGLFRPAVVVLTGISSDHVTSYGSREAIAREKRALLARLGPGGTAVVNADDELARATAAGLECRLLLAGRAEDADVRLTGMRPAPDGRFVTLHHEGREREALVPIHASHLVPLVALAAAAAVAAGIPLERALAGARRFRSPSGRMQLVSGAGSPTFLLDYFKSRTATAIAAVTALGELRARRRVAVMGEVQEGEHDATSYGPIAAELAAHADLVLAVGRCASPLRELLGSSRVVGVETVDAAARMLADELREGDAVLLHGATRQHLERVHLLLQGRNVSCLVRRCVFHWECTDCPYLDAHPPANVIEAA